MMADMDLAESVVLAASGSVEQTFRELRQMKTPQAAFEEARSALRVIFSRAIQGHHSAQSDAERETLLKDIQRYGHELSQLDQDHQATLDAKNSHFAHQRGLVLESLCRRLVQDIGRDLFQKVLQDLTNNPSDAVNRTSSPANEPTPPATEAGSEVVSPVEHAVRSPPANPQTLVSTDACFSSAVRMCIAAKLFENTVDNI